MADSRRYVMAIAGLACFLGLTGTASAQFGNGFSCTESATPLDMRAQGTTENAGDIILTCTGGTPTTGGSQIPQVDITVSTNVAITSRLQTGTSIPAPTEAVLLINEPGTSGTGAGSLVSICPSTGVGSNPACVMTATGSGGGIFAGTVAGTANDYNVATSPSPRFNGFQGTIVGTGQMTFYGVAVDPPGSNSTTTTNLGSLTMRITNLRVNASGLGIPTGFSVNSVFGTISTSAGFQIVNNVQTIGNVRNGLVFSSVLNSSNSSGSSPNSFQQCVSTTAAAETINFSEGFATALKLKLPPSGAPQPTVPGAVQNTESGFIPSPGVSYFPGIGTADWATRIKLTFNSVQAGVTVYVPITISSTQTGPGGVPLQVLTLVGVTSAAETSPEGTFLTSPTTGVTGLPSTYVAIATTANANNTFLGEAVYEVTTQLYSGSQNLSTSATESFVVTPWISYTASPSTNSPGLGTTTVQVDFAPTTITNPTSPTSSANSQPRFVQTSSALNGFLINSCATNLLFPFVTNVAGFDTGLAIASTSTDPFGTTAQSGVCTLNFYGSNAPAAFTTPNIASGTVYTTLASSIAAGFQGYMIAVCKFQFAHGFGFVTDGFGGPGRGLSQGYLPLIIPDLGSQGNSRKANDASKAATGDGEILAH